MSEQKLPVSIELGAKASLEIKAEVPKASAGRLVDALTDIIRPFTESRGLKADQIRLQRAEVAIEIARLAKLRIDARKQEIKSVSNKILVPLIERASNEDISDRVMISRWANLLAAAATEDSIPPIYVQILSQMSGRQALTLENVMLNEYSDWYFPFRTFEDSFLDLDSGISRKFFLLDFRDIKFKNAKEVYMLICDHFNRPGGYLHYIFDEKNFDAQSEVPHLQGEYKAGEELDLEICCALGLLKKEDFDIAAQIRGKSRPLSLTYFRFTSMGTELLNACSEDSVEKLKTSQAETADEYRANPKLKDRLIATRRKTRTPLSYWVR